MDSYGGEDIVAAFAGGEGAGGGDVVDGGEVGEAGIEDCCEGIS